MPPEVKHEVKQALFRKVALERLSSPEQIDSIMRVITPKAWLTLLPVYGLIALALASTLIGCLLAWGVQALLAQVIEQLGATTLPPPGLQPLVQATLLAVLLLAGGAG